VHVAALYFPPAQYVLRFEPIPPESWLRIVPVAATVVAAVEVHKWLRRTRPPGQATDVEARPVVLP